MCRWVHTTRSIFSRGLPAFSRSCRNGSFSLFHSGFERTLSLPMQVSTRILLPCDSSSSACIVSFSLPSSLVNGESQSRSFLTLSAVAFGSSIVPSQTASDSMIRVILTLPIVQWFMACSCAVGMSRNAHTAACGLTQTQPALPRRRRKPRRSGADRGHHFGGESANLIDLKTAPRHQDEMRDARRAVLLDPVEAFLPAADHHLPARFPRGGSAKHRGEAECFLLALPALPVAERNRDALLYRVRVAADPVTMPPQPIYQVSESIRAALRVP